MPMKPLDFKAVEVLGRAIALAAAYGLDVTGLVEALTPFADRLSDRALVTVPDTFDRIAITTALGRGPAALQRASELTGAVDSRQAARVAELLGNDVNRVHLEVESRPGDALALATTVRAFGNRDLDAVVQRLAGVSSAPAAAIDALTAGLVALGGEDRLVGITDRATAAGPESWSLFVAQRNEGERARAATRARLDEAAARLGVSNAQRNVVQDLHDVFAHDRESYAWMTLRPDGLAPGMGVVWIDVPFEHIVRMMIGFQPASDCGRRLGELAGALDAAAATVELQLLPTEPPHVRAAATIHGGRN